LAKFTVFHKLTIHRKDNFGQRLKLAFEELGITFIKIGQILSMRYDILSQDDCEALQGLLDNVRPIPPPTVYKIIENEYNRPLDQVFKNFKEAPLGSASVSQVHKAELFDGCMVAVKIKRPDVGHKFTEDINILKTLATISQLFSSTLRNVQARKLVDYFEGWIKQDMNFIQEVENIRKIKEQYSFATTGFRPDLGIAVFPSTFDGLCTPNIIVMDYIDGIPMSRKQEILADKNYDIEKSIKSYVNVAMRNWFREENSVYYFQGDPHLSNILVLPNGDAASIDFGLISELSKKEARMCKDLIIAVYFRDLKNVMKVAAEMTDVSEEQLEPIRPDIIKYLEKTKTEGLGFWFMEFVKIIIKHKFKFPLYLTTFGRTNLLLDGLIHAYMPDKTTLDIVGVELKRLAVREAWNNITEADWLKLSYSLSQKIKELPQTMAEFIEDPLGAVSRFAAAVRKAT
jgi:ubiquinone biosynthesis protein